MCYFDTHAHLLDEKFDGDRDELILSLPGKGVGFFTECASDMETAAHAVTLAQKYPMAYAAVGVHPHSAAEWEERDYQKLAELARQEKVVAIGEIGLDYHYDFSPRDVQKAVFARQMELAGEAGLPVVVHSREATQDVLAILRAYPAVTGVLHSFSGSVETMREVLEMGYYISLSGVVTFKNAKKAAEAAAAVPPDKLLIETDSPYMTPAPHRGKRNDPSYVQYTAQKIAEIRGMELEELRKVTTENAKAFFRISH
ncbi:MAG TPA: hydrolase TatD [Clostridiales bacterium]|nr:hydrolase TatD [Clostridiales bacterium]